MRDGTRALAVAALLLTAGCYVHRPVRPADAVLDTRVRAAVSPRQAAELEPIFGPSASSVSGTLVERTGDGILLEVATYGATPGMSGEALRNRVSIPFTELTALEARELSAWRTAVVIGALGAGVLGTWAVSTSGDADIGDKPGTGVDNAVIALFRMAVGLLRRGP